jgi:mannosyltransferase OCH1-like enzyme
MTEFKYMMSGLQGFDENLFENDWRWKLLEDLYQKNWYPSENGKGRIPNIIHQIWVGGKPFPEKYQFWVDTWKRLNPHFKYKLWTDADIDELDLPNKALYKAIPNNGPKSDILRYHILNKYGGIYIDTDFECLKSFSALSNLSFYTSIGYQWGNWNRVELYPGLMACVPGHPIMTELANRIDKLTIEEFEAKGVHATTSSYFFTKVFFDIVREYQEGIVATPPEIFYPFPNHKNHWEDVGRRYIKKNSYAVHHWEVSWTGGYHKEDWVQGEKYVKIADFVYAPQNKAGDDYAKYPNTFDPAELKDDDVNFVYTCTMYLGRLLRILNNLPQKFVVINHNGDQHVEDEVIGTFANAKKIAEEPYVLTDNIVKLYTVNPDVVHPRIELIAVGLENSMWKSSKRDIISSLRANPVPRSHFALMNHSMSTNREERQRVYDLFKPKSWVHTYDKTTYQEFYYLLATHKFVFNPMGNCFDNHRMWEAWYLGCIPITKRSVMTSFYEDMPIVIIDDWSQVTEEYLKEEYIRITNMDCNLDKLNFQYWKNKIMTLR